MNKTQGAVILHVSEPTKMVSWRTFNSSAYPRYSIALDGFVTGPPRTNYSRPCINFNHHEGVIRFATRATCEQVSVALAMGLFDLFRRNNSPYAHLYINDWDQDVVLSVYQLTRHPNIKGPLMTRLINVQGLLDMSAGSYPIHPDQAILREFAWIFEPYVEARMSGRLTTMTSSETRHGLSVTCDRIDQYMLGKGRQVPLDPRYKVLRGGSGWKLVEMQGYYARLKMHQDGIFFFVNYRGLINGKVACSIGCEPFINANLPRLFKKLSACEKDGREWGGSDTIGSSHRGLGSNLSLDEIFEIVEEHAKKLNIK